MSNVLLDKTPLTKGSFNIVPDDKHSQLDINISVCYQQFDLEIKLPIPLNGIAGIFGHSASGKSTLLRAIAGLEKKLVGEITLTDTNIADKVLVNTTKGIYLKPEERQIGLVFQNSRLFGHLSVLGNLEYAVKRCKNRRLDLNEVIELTELTALLEHQISELSGGQQQRVALARAILAEPKLLLLDEPLSALDQHSKTQLLKMILNIQKKLNLPMLYVSHSLDELQQVCDTLLVLAQGKVVNFGNIHQVIHQLNNFGESTLIHQQTSLSLAIKQFNNGHGLTVLALNAQQEIYLISDKSFENQTQLRCFILASDISIALTEPNNSSIVNHLFGTIKQISNKQNKVLLTISCGSQEFFVTISAFSQQKLSLASRQQVYLQFKASAVRTFIH
ncbi:molybdenum ABC transporter ATP-binding protein [Colwellia sp. 75C3]|uniref:molybdenum ABC transporter ATP-binding protein n=1 Tax=Colwellia sp. 75C3 TaxID=888425 RepID=UPI000C323E92|nr:molybdenum ABC transporter ATP-binding protein [Colwellia sp. 75C3]PKG85194.1 molybdenum ABC transporter ATP-binding protein [Colwellia sp. 75C3]